MNRAIRWANSLWRRLRPESPRRAVITEPSGQLNVGEGPATFLVAVGPGFRQNVPNALMTARMGYCRAFEKLGIPYRLVDVADLLETLDAVPNPICFLIGYEYGLPWFSEALVRRLRDVPHFVWVNPWFAGSDDFFAHHGLDASVWDWSAEHRRRIIESHPRFVFTATAPRGMGFFEQWQKHGLNTVSLPLACDTTLYHPRVPRREEFEGVRMAFVGGYWASKSQQIDPYLRPFEDELMIYGYNQWPYRGYRGQLAAEAEPALYRQAMLCPTINEPSVAILHGQINERVFKVLGSGGATVVDAVAAYRDFFSKDELPVPADREQFIELVRAMLDSESLRAKWRARGHAAVLDRHTYLHRARQALKLMDLEPLIQTPFTERRRCA